MAILTASAQLRSSGQDGSAIADELKQFAHRDDWQDSILEYATKYSGRVQEDYRNFVDDCKTSGLTVEAGDIEKAGKVPV